MKKEIVINTSTAETRIALLEDGQLAEIFVERPENERHVGDIYLGRVRKVLNGISAAFVDIGWEQDGFLHFNDVGSLYEMDDAEEEGNGGSSPNSGNGNGNGNGRSRSPAQVNLRAGQEILVQITKEPIGGKGPRVTSQVSLPGRFVVLVPNEELIGVSRKISDPKEKRRLKKLGKDLKEYGYGLIIRTVAQEKDDETLRADIEKLVSTWRRIEKKMKGASAPTLIYKEMSLASSVIRDLFGPDIDHVVVDSKTLYKELNHYLEDVSPTLVDRLELYRDRVPLFDHYQIESEIEKGIRRKVYLAGGGYIIIEHTEAMVVVDVNSGRFVGKQNHEENSLKVNLRAAREICRQLRLRDIGGIIVIDFIDLWDEKNRKKIYDEVKKELKRDRAKVDVAPISHFGLMLMTRQRIKPSLLFTFKEPCPTCHGSGMIPSKETVVTELERWVARYLNRTSKRRLRLAVHPDMHAFLTQGGLRSRLNKIMLQQRILIRLTVDAALPPSEFRGFTPNSGQDVTDQYRQ